MKRLILMAMLPFILFLNCGWAPSAKTREALSQKEAYFNDPKNDVLFVITAVNIDNGSEVPDWEVEVALTMSDGSGTNTLKTRTPCVMRFPMNEAMTVMFEEYRKLSGADRERFLMEATLRPSTITIVAQSQAEYAGIGGHVYFAGKEVLYDIAAIEYGVVNLSYNLPVRELLEAAK